MEDRGPVALGAPIAVDGRPPRATVVVYRLNDIGGAEVSTVLFLERLARTEFEVRVVVLTGACDFASRPELEGLGMQFIEVHASWWGRARILLREMVQHPPDIVHTTLFGADVLGRLVAPVAGAPAMVSVVNMQYSPEAMAVAPSPKRLEILRRLERFLSRHLTSAFHALTAAGGRYATERLGADPGRIVVVPRGRKLDRYEVAPERAAATRAELGLAPDVPVLVNCARQEPQKGQDLLVEAFALVLADHPDAVLLQAGRPGNATPALLAAVERLGIGDHIRFLDVRTDVPELLALSQVFVSSARYEGFGGAVLEAMASGTPVVGFEIGPVAEVLHGTGTLVPLGDVAGLAAAIGEVLDDPERAAAMGAASLAEARGRFSADAVAAHLVQLYRDVVTDRTRFPLPPLTRFVRRVRRR